MSGPTPRVWQQRTTRPDGSHDVLQHLRGLGALEDQMCQMTVRGFEGRGSPDRVDALVWAIHELVIEPAANWRRPQVRTL